AGSTLLRSSSIANHPPGGSIGSAATTVDVATTFNVTQTTTGQTLTLPSPTTATAGRLVYINDVGTTGFTMYGVAIASGNSAGFIWNGSAWTPTDSGSGVNTIGTLDGVSPAANGAVIAGSVLYLQSASASVPGLVSTTTQTFAGDKTFSGNVTLGGTVTVSGFGAGVVQSDGSGNLSSGTLSVSNGGTGDISLTSHGVLLGNGTGAVQTATGTSGQLLVANVSGVPTFTTL